MTDTVTLTIDGIEVTAPKGALVIRVAEQLGISIPRFCDHPLLAPAGACRQCLVDVEGQRKPVASCTQTVMDGMVVRTQRTSEVARKAQEGIMEFLLINHPLDCPMCDKGGECPLQNQAMSAGRSDSRFHEPKRTYEKPIAISSQVLLDRERCVLCQRCTRFSEEIAGDPFIDLMERGAAEQIGVFRGDPADPSDDVPFNSYFSGNTVQICPVGALTSAAYRFRARPFDLVSSPTVCEHCAAGCALRTDHRRGKVMRRLAGDDPEVNEEWNCDKGRFAFGYAGLADRLTHPLVRDEESGSLRPASWPEALAVAGRGLAAAQGRVGVLAGGRLTIEDAYAYGKFARTLLGTNDIDFRARAHSEEEAGFLAAGVGGTGLTVTYSDLERAKTVVLVGFEPEDESPIIFLRLRKAQRHGTRVIAIASHTTRGLDKLDGRLIPTAPGDEAAALSRLTDDPRIRLSASDVILVGERLATSPGALSVAADLAGETGAKLGWVPRRAGERGAVDAGCLPNLLPGGRPVEDPMARSEVAAAWNADLLPGLVGRDTDGILEAVRSGLLKALVIGGVELVDLPDPDAAVAAVDQAEFVVSLEIRASEVTERADVVLPVAAVAERSGAFVDWEGRLRPFDAVLPDTSTIPDLRVLAGIAEEMDASLGFRTVEQARAELSALGAWDGDRAPMPTVEPVGAPATSSGSAVLSTWRQLLDDGRLQEGDPYLAATARTPMARLSVATMRSLDLADGDEVVLRTDTGAVALPVESADLPDNVAWAPQNSAGLPLNRLLNVGEGDVVRLEKGAPS